MSPLKTWTLPLLLFGSTLAQAADVLYLANNPWPPFVIEGDEKGTAEQLVCEALDRAGWQCDIVVEDWQTVLDGARSGELDGIAAVWKSPERETFLQFSQPYLTNRMIAITSAGAHLEVTAPKQLSGMRVGLVRGYAYGGNIDDARADFEVVEVDGDLAAMQAVRDGKVHAAIVDELIARRYLDQGQVDGIKLGDAALDYRELYFGVSRQHPLAAEIVDAFNRSFQLMLEDGTVNEILEIDWLAADVGMDGDIDFVLRKSVMPDQLDDPTTGEGVFAYRQQEYLQLTRPGSDTLRPGYRVDGVDHDSLAEALNSAYGRQRVCGYERWSSSIVCSETKTQ